MKRVVFLKKGLLHFFGASILGCAGLLTPYEHTSIEAYFDNFLLFLISAGLVIPCIGLIIVVFTRKPHQSYCFSGNFRASRSDPTINPSTGLPMISNDIDSGGNIYGSF